MIELSLKHRVKMDQKAQVAGNGAFVPKSRALLVITALVAAFNVFFVVAGAVIAAILAYDRAVPGGSRPGWWYNDGHVVLHRIQLFFFYCTIPLFLSIASCYDALRIYRGTHRASLMLISCLVGIGLWTVQWGLEGSCVWSFGERGATAGGQYCPFAFAGSSPTSWGHPSSWRAGVALAWTVPWLCVPLMLIYSCYLAFSVMALINTGRKVPEVQRAWHSYSYDQVDKGEGQGGHEFCTIRDGRPPAYLAESTAYRGESMFHEQLYDEKTAREYV